MRIDGRRFRFASPFVALVAASGCITLDGERFHEPAPVITTPAPSETVVSTPVPPESKPASQALPTVPKASAPSKPLPISLATALALADANPLDVQIADERVRAACARLDRAEALWLPNINLGLDYFRHDGQIQDIVGQVFTTSRSAFLVGAGPQAVVSVSDALFAPVAARQLVRSAQADARAARNDTTLAVATAYFNVPQARGDVAGAAEALRRADDLVART
ncbi:MAG TPA: TolC family protein, partial [Planctomycetia bacterium]|nr:TolC family protein [Planctomycetia bacterium]